MRAAALLVAGALCAATMSPALASAADDEASDEADPDQLDQPALGARGPELGSFVIHGSLGFALILPQITLGARAGLGAGFGLDAAYRNLAAFGQGGVFRLLWGTSIGHGVELGLAYRTAISTLEAADGGLIGITFSSLPIGNDWVMGNDIVLTWRRPGSAHVTASLGPTFTMGGTRFESFDEQAEGFVFDAAIRGIEAAIQGEWPLWSTTNVVLRLEALALLGVEQDEACAQANQEDCGQLVPIGFIPTGTLGFAWML